MKNVEADKVIFGAGIFGLYAALKAGRHNQKVIILEYDNTAFSRASFINQARVHNGYHYPRSFSTAIKSSEYYHRFCKDFEFAINKTFTKIYGIAREYSWTNPQQFIQFCENAGIKCKNINHAKFFREGMIEAAFETEELSLDALKIKDFLLSEIKKYPNIQIQYNARIQQIEKESSSFMIFLSTSDVINTKFVLNATYGSTNQIMHLLKFPLFKIKYELCEMILCTVSDKLKNYGLTVLDGPFFSIMPFGLSKFHSLSAVPYTPHRTSNNALPDFKCQEGVICNPSQLENCNTCKNKPKSAWPSMFALARKFLHEDIKIASENSLFAIKTILAASEIDDSRPTVIRKLSDKPYFYTVLSGKLNTIYDLDEILV